MIGSRIAPRRTRCRPHRTAHGVVSHALSLTLLLAYLTGFVAVDDRALLTEVGGAALFGRFVQTDKLDGLDSAAAERMLVILQEQASPLQAWSLQASSPQGAPL